MNLVAFAPTRNKLRIGGWFVAFLFVLGAIGCKTLGVGGASPDKEKSASESAVPAPPPVIQIRSSELALDQELLQRLDPSVPFALGIEREVQEGFPHLRNRRVTFFTDSTALSTRGVHSLEILSSSVLVSLPKVVLLDDHASTPTKALENWLAANTKSAVYTVGPDDYKPADEVFNHCDILVWDLALRGTRTGLDALLLFHVQKAAALRGIPLLILDRPPVGSALVVEAPVGDAARAGSRESYYPIALTHGMTSAELARMMSGRFGLAGTLYTVPMNQWTRSMRNSWLVSPQWELTEKGREALADLAAHPVYANGYHELRLTSQLIGDGAFSSRKFQIVDGVPTLHLVPSQVPTTSMLERLDLFKSPAWSARLVELPAKSGSGVTATIAITPVEGEQVMPVDLSVKLRVAASPRARYIVPDTEPSLYAVDNFMQPVERGLSPDQFRRRWAATEEFQRFQREREKVLLYQP